MGCARKGRPGDRGRGGCVGLAAHARLSPAHVLGATLYISFGMFFQNPWSITQPRVWKNNTKGSKF